MNCFKLFLLKIVFIKYEYLASLRCSRYDSRQVVALLLLAEMKALPQLFCLHRGASWCDVKLFSPIS